EPGVHLPAIHLRNLFWQEVRLYLPPDLNVALKPDQFCFTLPQQLVAEGNRDFRGQRLRHFLQVRAERHQLLSGRISRVEQLDNPDGPVEMVSQWDGQRGDRRIT